MSALRLSCIPRTRDSGPTVTVCHCYTFHLLSGCVQLSYDFVVTASLDGLVRDMRSEVCF